MNKLLTDEVLDPRDGILHHAEGVDLLPANIELSGLEVCSISFVTASELPVRRKVTPSATS